MAKPPSVPPPPAAPLPSEPDTSRSRATWAPSLSGVRSPRASAAGSPSPPPRAPEGSVQTWDTSQATRADPPDAADPPPTAPGPPLLPPRYTWRCLLGRGGMGEVHRVTDHELEREVALKVLFGAHALSPSAWERFLQEARLTAGLQHPGIIPVYDLGALPDGRAWYTMREVVGESLAASWGQPPPDLPTLRRRVTTLVRVCEAVGYAHDQGGVLHRDLKPANVMRGPFGEVLVVDWGLAVLTGTDGPTGAVSGTPSYMAPEQARGELDALSPATDVWALGAMLVCALTGRPPHPATDVHALLTLLRSGPPPPPCPFTDPDRLSLLRIAQRALSPAPPERFESGTALARTLDGWLDGSEQRAEALEHVARADAAAREAQVQHTRADTLSQQATALLGALSPGAGETERRPAWDLEDAARQARALAQDADDAATHLLRSALVRRPGLPEAMDRLADRFRAAHARAEADGDHRRARRLLAELRAHDRGSHAPYLRGGGWLTLRTDPPGARVVAQPFVSRGRRLVLGTAVELGTTPLRAVPLPHGSWHLTLTAPGRAPGRLPIVVARGQHVGHADHDPAAEPIPLPWAHRLGPTDLFLPPGWFVAGGSEPIVDRPLPRTRRFAPALIARRCPVTLRDLLDWYGRLCREGSEDRALTFCPRMHRTTPGSPSGASMGLDAAGEPRLLPDQDGDVWNPDWPALMITWHGAVAVAADLARWSDRPWRLPGELEWEWMARGADGRVLPWGTEHLAPEWCRMRSTLPVPLPAPVDQHPIDEGPSGVRGLAGNVMEWCAEPYPATTHSDDQGRLRPAPPDPTTVGGQVNVRGGAYSFAAYSCRATIRRTHAPTNRNFDLGFRVVRSLVPEDTG